MKKKAVNRANKKGPLWLLVRGAVFVSFVLCVISIVYNQSEVSDLEKKLSSINQKTEELEAENIEYQRILENDDIDAYMEKLAIENLNYAYPNERRFYDTSRN